MLIGVAILVSFGWHAAVKTRWIAVIGSVMTTLLIVHLVLGEHFTWVDDRFFAHPPITLGIAALVSVIVGQVFGGHETWEEEDEIFGPLEPPTGSASKHGMRRSSDD